MPRSSYLWSDDARSLEIELALSLVERLSMSAFEAFKSLPHRGLEIGGLLLGSIRQENHRTLVSITDYVEVASEHRSGPSYHLSPADMEVLDYTCAAHSEAVGMYRTATQSQNLALHEDDPPIFYRHFREPGNIYLLIHPATRTAAFCLPESGSLTIVHEFAFQASGLVMPEAASLSDPEPPGAAPTVQVASSKGRAWAIRVAALCIGGLLGALAWQWLAPPLAHTATTLPPARVSPALAKSPSDPDHVTLDVARDGRVLKLSWDRQAPAVRTADRAVLHILDGTHETNLNLTTGELSTGLLSYWAESPDVTFRLEVFGAGRQTNDSIRAVGGIPSPAAVATATAPVQHEPIPQHSWKPAPDALSTDDAAATSAARSTPDPPRPSPSVAPSKPEPAPMVAIAPPPPAPSAPPANVPPPGRSVEPPVDVSAEPVTGSKLTRVVHHIPLLRRLKK